MSRVAIAGAGLVGRLMAWRLARAGHDVHVVDPAPGPEAPRTGVVDAPADHAAAFTAAGLLCPWAELDQADVAVARLGRRSLARWPAIEAQLGAEPGALVRCDGSLLVAHGGDAGAAARALARIEAGGRAAFEPSAVGPRACDASALRALEPALAPGLAGWFLAEEGCVHPRETMALLARRAAGVAWHWRACVAHVRPGELHLVDGRVLRADLAIDARGLGARRQHGARGARAGEDGCDPRDPHDPHDLHDLRGVRGETVWLHAPGLRLARPVRLLHPRHRVYLAPRPGDLVVLGASEVESEDRSPVSLRSAVELMAAAQSVVPALAEARLVHLEANLRPALPDHRPHVQHEPGRLCVNGLFRHGWLVAPALVDDALAMAGLAAAAIDAEPNEALHG